MGWDDRLVKKHEIEHYPSFKDGSLGSMCEALIEHQREHWPMLREGYDAFGSLETKRVKVEESEVVIQHNPRRIGSTAAAVDPAAVSARRCFLCEMNLPAEEKGIAYEDLVILCNPYPVLAKHLSIVHRNHGEQKIAGNAGKLLDLARELGSGYFVLYNGPECGASAPDHLHFQACSSELLPIAEHLFDEDPVLSEECSTCEETAANTFELFTLGGCGRTTVVMRGGNSRELERWIYRLLDELGQLNEKPEPMVNIIATYAGRLWTVYLFPRARHRPASFFEEREKRLTVSPGAIDMAGVVVVPERAHYEKLDGERLVGIYREVSYSEELVNEMLDSMTSAEATFFRD